MIGQIEKNGESIFYLEGDKIFLGTWGGVRVALTNAVFENEGLYLFIEGQVQRITLRCNRDMMTLDGGFMVCPDLNKNTNRSSIDVQNQNAADFNSIRMRLIAFGII